MPKEAIPQERPRYIASFCSMLLQMHQTLPNYFSSWDRHWFLHTRPWFYSAHTLHQPREQLAQGWDLHRFSPGTAPILVCSDHNENCTRVLATWDPTPMRQILPCRMPWVSHPWVKTPRKLKKEHASHMPQRSPTGWPKSCGSQSLQSITGWHRFRIQVVGYRGWHKYWGPEKFLVGYIHPFFCRSHFVVSPNSEPQNCLDGKRPPKII